MTTKKFHYKEFETTEMLVQQKRKKGCTISVILPALNEAATIGPIVSYIRNQCMKKNSLIDELIVIDSSSVDKTAEIADREGAIVYDLSDIGPDFDRVGKGVALWKSQYVANGDILLFIDTDILDFDKRFVNGLLGPLLFDDTVCFSKAFYRRPLIIGSGTYDNYGGRVTEILVRPLLSAILPDLAQLIQPLAGEYAIRRSIAEKLPFWSGYGVEIGLLFDLFNYCGLSSMAQVDMEKRHHRNRNVTELGRMAFGILHVMFTKLERMGYLSFHKELGHTLISSGNSEWESYSYDELELPPFFQQMKGELSDATV